MQNEKQKLKLEAEVLVRLMCIGGKAERRSHSGGGAFRGELPGAPSQAVTDSSLENKMQGNQMKGGGCCTTQLSHLQRILVGFLGSLKVP